MAASDSLYEKVVEVTDIYLGPAADRFIARQIRNHLQMEPEDLGRPDLKELIDWIRLAMAVLTDDQRMVSSYITSLEHLATNKNRSTKRA